MRWCEGEAATVHTRNCESTHTGHGIPFRIDQPHMARVREGRMCPDWLTGYPMCGIVPRNSAKAPTLHYRT